MRILLAHDKVDRRKHYAGLLEQDGLDVDTADCGEDAVQKALLHEYSVVILDILMPVRAADIDAGRQDQEGGMFALGKIQKSRPLAPVILFSRHGLDEQVRKAVATHRIFDYIIRDEDNFEFKFRARVGNAVEVYESRRARLGVSPHIISVSPAMQAVLTAARKVAESDIPVLLCGETGAGKSLLAAEIHASSNRKGKPYLELNCASLPENLVESEIFGHAKGAFTGATANKRGYFERAHPGTLFLDEIGEMSAAMQAKLLRVIETGTFVAVGGETEQQVEVRLLCATNRRLEDRVSAGQFREDLYYRICYEKIEIPPLRERREDIPPLIDHFVAQHATQYNRDISVREGVYKQFTAMPLRGNVRELKSMVKAALYRMECGENLLTAYHFSPTGTPSRDAGDSIKESMNNMGIDGLLDANGVVDLNTLLDDYKFKIIDRAMQRSDNIAEKAATLLSINPHTLRRYLRQHKNTD